MGDILEFPSPQAQGLAYLDRQLRQLLAAKGADPELIDFAVDQLKHTYTRFNQSKQYTFNLHLPEGLTPQARDELQLQISAGLEGLRQDNHRLVLALVVELVLAEVRLFQQQREE